MRKQRGEDRPALLPGRAVVLDPDVAEAVELGQQLAGPGLVQAIVRLRLQPAQDVVVVMQPPGLAVEVALIWQRSMITGSSELYGGSSPPNMPLQASSTRRSSRSPPAAGSISSASTTSGRPLSPWSERPSTHSVASLWRPTTRSTRSPAHGVHVRRYPKPVELAHSGPNRSPRFGVAVGQCVGLVRRDAVHRPSNLEYLWISSVSPDQRMTESDRPPGQRDHECTAGAAPPTLRVVRLLHRPRRARGGYVSY